MIRVAAGTSLAGPVHLRFVTTGEDARRHGDPRARRRRGRRFGDADRDRTKARTALNHQPNDVVEIVAGDRDEVQHVRLNAEGDEALALSTLAVRLGAHVVVQHRSTSLPVPRTSRHQVFVTFAGEHSKAQINGAAMIKGSQHADTTLVVDHAVPHCESRELFKTVIDGEATGVFQGKIIVRPHAQKTDGRMMSAALLLSEGGAMNNKPELEIFADDVQCAHGATCGELDEDLLFYLMARGLPKAEAERCWCRRSWARRSSSSRDDEARESADCAPSRTGSRPRASVRHGKGSQ